MWTSLQISGFSYFSHTSCWQVYKRNNGLGLFFMVRARPLSSIQWHSRRFYASNFVAIVWGRPFPVSAWQWTRAISKVHTEMVCLALCGQFTRTMFLTRFRKLGVCRVSLLHRRGIWMHIMYFYQNAFFFPEMPSGTCELLCALITNLYAICKYE
jgi:hypothetical protein